MSHQDPAPAAGIDEDPSREMNGSAAPSLGAAETETPPWNLDGIVSDLRLARQEWRESHGKRERTSRDLPSREVLQHIVRELSGVLFPLRLGPPDLRRESEDYYVGHTLAEVLNALEIQVSLELKGAPGYADARRLRLAAREKTRRFGESLAGIRRILDTDLEAAFLGDPAARSVDEVLVCYPGVIAIIHYRLAHTLYKLDLPLIARIITETAHSETGIDIHPGAAIGSGFFIDHGTGVVIGETAIIGDRVRLYQAVTLGAKSFPKAEDGSLRKGIRRHPIVEDDVVIYAGATVLGRITIGKGTIIGGNIWLTRSTPPGSVVSQAGPIEEVLNDGADI